MTVTKRGRRERNPARAAAVAAAAVAVVVAAAAAVVAVVAVVAVADRSRRRHSLDRASTAVADLYLPPAVFKTCPWQPRSLVETGLRQWLRCGAPALRDRRAIGMPSHAVDEAWHGLILCTAVYSAFCAKAYGRFLHHRPIDGAPAGVLALSDPMDEQLRRTVIAWSLVAEPGEQCVLWDLDERIGVDRPWGLAPGRIAEIEAAIGRRDAGAVTRKAPARS
jgi:hypothetical protein